MSLLVGSSFVIGSCLSGAALGKACWEGLKRNGFDIHFYGPYGAAEKTRERVAILAGIIFNGALLGACLGAGGASFSAWMLSKGIRSFTVIGVSCGAITGASAGVLIVLSVIEAVNKRISSFKGRFL